MEITLLGTPRTTNKVYKSRVLGRFASVYMSQEGKDLKESYQWQAKSQWKLPVITGDVRLSVDLYFGTKRKCDIDNFNKLVLDSLTGIVYEDDSQIQELTLRKFYDKQNPRVVVTYLNTL